MSRLRREIKTIEAMIRMYCRHHHINTAGCSACEELLSYAVTRTGRCRFLPHKPVCSECKVHCYKPEAREQIRQVMRWAGPRMVWRHPWFALMHLSDSMASRRQTQSYSKVKNSK